VAVVAVATSPSMSASRATTHRSPVIVLLQIAGAGLLLAMAGIHFYLWLDQGYKDIMPIGPLFLANTVGGTLLAIAVLVSPQRYFALVALLATLFDAGTLAALLISLTGGGLLGFHESIQAPLATTTIWVEGVGVVVLAVLTVFALRARGRSV
jgi:hypothetical protein